MSNRLAVLFLAVIILIIAIEINTIFTAKTTPKPKARATTVSARAHKKKAAGRATTVMARTPTKKPNLKAKSAKKTKASINAKKANTFNVFSRIFNSTKDIMRARSGSQVTISGNMKFLDSLFGSLLPIGDKYHGLPDDLIGLGKFCVEFFVKGMTIVAFTTVRYPTKILLKAIVAAGVISWGPTVTFFCLNPMRMAQFISKAKALNVYHDEFSRIVEEGKLRAINTADKVHTNAEKQKHGCCAWFHAKKKISDTVTDDLKEFVTSTLSSLFSIQESIFCGEIMDGSPECDSIQFIDDPPVRMMGRSFLTHVFEVFLQFY